MFDVKDIKVLIVEDEVLIAEDLKDMLISFGLVDVEMVHSKGSAITLLNSYQPHIALLDIRMEGDLDGLEIAEFINAGPKIPFVFITSHSDLAMIKKIVKEKPAGYLTKPFKRSDIYAAINLIIEERKSTAQKIMIKDGIKTVIFEPYEIDYVEGEGNYIYIYSGKRKILARQSLESIAQLLDAEKYFRIHRSYIVNIDRIDNYTKKEVAMGEVKLPIARSIISQFEEKMIGKNKG